MADYVSTSLPGRYHVEFYDGTNGAAMLFERTAGGSTYGYAILVRSNLTNFLELV